MGAVTFEIIDKNEAWEMFDQLAQKLLGIDGATFCARQNAGVYRDTNDVDVERVAMMRPHTG